MPSRCPTNSAPHSPTSGTPSSRLPAAGSCPATRRCPWWPARGSSAMSTSPTGSTPATKATSGSPRRRQGPSPRRCGRSGRTSSPVSGTSGPPGPARRSTTRAPAWTAPCGLAGRAPPPHRDPHTHRPIGALAYCSGHPARRPPHAAAGTAPCASEPHRKGQEPAMEATTLIESFRVDGKVAVVTGAGSGIGRASALALAGAGAAVVCADINEEGAAATARQIAAAGGTGEGVALDVSDRRGVDALAERVAAERGGIHIWSNIAGIMVEGPFLEAGEEDFDRILSVNLKGVFFGCQAAGRVMVTQAEGGSIINTS